MTRIVHIAVARAVGGPRLIAAREQASAAPAKIRAKAVRISFRAARRGGSGKNFCECDDCRVSRL